MDSPKKLLKMILLEVYWDKTSYPVLKQSLRQNQKLSLNVTASLGNQIKLLSLSGFEISTKLNELINGHFDEED